MKLLPVLMAAVITAACLASASAAVYPTFDGATGVVALPTAKTAAPGTINLALSYQQAPNNWRLAAPRANVALGRNLEVWAGSAQWRGYYNYNADNAGLKFRLLSQEQGAGIDLAIGGSLGRDKWKGGDGEITKGFAALTKDFQVGGATCSLTGGAMYNRFNSDGWSDRFVRPYAALEICGVKGFDLAIEYRQRDEDADDDEVPMSAVLRYSAPDKPVWIEIGTTNASDLGLSWDNQRGFFGVGVALGGK